jgi:hypothetical protein
MLGAGAMIPAVRAARRLLRWPETTSDVIPAQRWTLLTFLLYAVGTGVGFLLG